MALINGVGRRRKAEKGSSIASMKYILLCCCRRTSLTKRRRSMTDLFLACVILSSITIDTFYPSFAVSLVAVARDYSLYGVHSHCAITSNFEASYSEPLFNRLRGISSVVLTTTHFARWIVSLVLANSPPRFDRLPIFDLSMFTR